LAGVLRRKGCSSLRKTHLLFLARAWGYKSELWCRRTERRQHLAKTDPARAAAAAPRPPQPPPPAKRPRDPAAAPAKAARPKFAALTARGGPSFPFDAQLYGPYGPGLLRPRLGAARSTAGGISSWAVDVRLGPATGVPLAPPDVAAAAAADDARAPLAAIESQVQLALAPLARASTTAFLGSPADDCRQAPLAPAARDTLAAAMLSAADWLHGRATDLEAALMSLRARAAALPPAASATVAWLQLLGRDCPLESEMLKLQAGLHRVTVEFGEKGSAPLWPEQVVQGALMGLELVARCQALAVQSKFVSYGTYCKITIQLKALVAAYAAEVVLSLRARCARLPRGPAELPAPAAAAAAEVADTEVLMPGGSPLMGQDSCAHMAQIFGLLLEDAGVREVALAAQAVQAATAAAAGGA